MTWKRKIFTICYLKPYNVLHFKLLDPNTSNHISVYKKVNNQIGLLVLGIL